MQEKKRCINGVVKNARLWMCRSPCLQLTWQGSLFNIPPVVVVAAFVLLLSSKPGKPGTMLSGFEEVRPRCSLQYNHIPNSSNQWSKATWAHSAYVYK